jgi:hypothetical protein
MFSKKTTNIIHEQLIVSSFPSSEDLITISSWFLSLSVAFFVVKTILNHKKVHRSNGEGAYLGAFQITCIFPMTYVAYLGLHAWYFGALENQTAIDRLFSISNIQKCNKIGLVQIAFQLWDFVFSLFNSELNKTEMLIHHAMTGLLCYWMLSIPFCGYYGIYFMGCSEASSLPLCVVDFFRFYPEYGAKKYAIFNTFCSLLFAFMFLWFRVIQWISYSIGYWKDALYVLNLETLPTTNVPRFVIMSVLVLNIFFTVLQLVWCTMILKEARNMFFGTQQDGKGKNEEPAASKMQKKKNK